MILSTPPTPHYVHQEAAAGDTWQTHHDGLPENQQDAGHDQNKLVATTDTHDAKGASDGLWEELLALLPNVHAPVDFSFEDDMNLDDFNSTMEEFGSTMEEDLDGGPHEMSKDMKIDIDNNNECVGLTQKELEGGPSKKPKLMMDSTGNKDECAGQKLKEVDGGPSEKPKPTMDRIRNKVVPGQYCEICNLCSGHGYRDCPDRLKGMGLLCGKCERQACKECVKEHRDDVMEALKYCAYCTRLGNHWIEKCPMVEIHRREAQMCAEYDGSKDCYF